MLTIDWTRSRAESGNYGEWVCMLNNLANHLPEAVMIMLPPLTSFPLDEFVLTIAAEACFTARKQLAMVDKSKFWTETNLSRTKVY